MTQFEHLGFHIDHFVKGKYIGALKVETNPGPTTGYHSTKLLTAAADIKIGKKIIKKGTEYKTIVWPLCGRIIKN
jgi:hypothetical protein